MIAKLNPKKRIVIIDDDLQMVETLIEQIKNSDLYEVYHYAESIESFFAKEVFINFEVILLDIRLPGISGVDAIMKIKEACPNVEIIMLSAVEDPDIIFKALRLGAVGYILKAEIKTSIIDQLKIYSENGAVLSPMIARKIIQYYHPTNKIKMLRPKEEAILKLMADGYSYEDAATTLGMSIDMVRYYIKKIYVKLHVNNKVEAVRKYFSFIK